MKFYWVDVFAEKKFEGNQLAVFVDVDEMPGEKMQEIAREMNLSETTFVLSSDSAKNEQTIFRTRIFTVDEELPFAGHPTLGTAFVLRELHGLQSVTLGLKVGNIPVSFESKKDGIFGEMVQNEPRFKSVHDRVEVARALNLIPSDLEDDLPIQTVSTGNPFIIVPLKSLEILQNIHPDYPMMNDYLKKSDARFMYLVTRDTKNSGAILRARMIFYGGEDPATGSAAGPATAWLLKYGLLSPDSQAWIEQGAEINRPSKIFVRGSMQEGNPTDIRVGGHCFIVAAGELNP